MFIDIGPLAYQLEQLKRRQPMIVGKHRSVIETRADELTCRDCMQSWKDHEVYPENCKTSPIERALATQEAGSHYVNLPVQPAEYCHRNRLGKLEGDVVYYVTRWRTKNGLEDLRKARHTLDILIELESKS